MNWKRPIVVSVEINQLVQGSPYVSIYSLSSWGIHADAADRFDFAVCNANAGVQYGCIWSFEGTAWQTAERRTTCQRAGLA